LTKILAVIPTLADDPTETIKSISEQTVKVSKILVAVGSKELYEKLTSKNLNGVEYFYVKPDFREPLGKRVATAINTVLAKENLREYDYLLKVDDDVVLPKRFIEENIEINADYVGGSGYAMILKVSSFLKIFNGKFAEVAADDTYVGLKFLHRGFLVKQWRCLPVLVLNRPPHSYRHFFSRGIEMYKLGYEPIHVFERIRWDRRCVFSILGYFTAMLKGIERYDFANWVLKTQIKRLIYGKQRED